MSKETVYHGRQYDVHSVHSMYEVTERDRKLKPGWKVLVRLVYLSHVAGMHQCGTVFAQGEQGSPDRL